MRRDHTTGIRPLTGREPHRRLFVDDDRPATVWAYQPRNLGAGPRALAAWIDDILDEEDQPAPDRTRV